MDILLLNLGTDFQGEVTLGGYAGQVEILSFLHGISTSIVHGLTGRTGTTGTPRHQDFTMTKYIDLSSTALLDACDRGLVIPEATFTLAHTEGDVVTPYWVVTMKEAIITSVAIGGGGGSRPTETITLNYTAIRWVYQTQTAAGEPVTNTSAWNLATNTSNFGS